MDFIFEDHTAKTFRLVIDHPNVTFGSYPSWLGQHYRTKLTLEGDSKEEVAKARSEMDDLHPVKFDPKPTEDAWNKVQQFLEDVADKHMVDVVEGSLKVIEDCFSRSYHLGTHFLDYPACSSYVLSGSPLKVSLCATMVAKTVS